MSVAVESVPISPELRGKWSTGHAAVVVVLALGLSAATAVRISVPALGQTLLLAVMTAVVGIPHGALDHRFGRALCRPWAGRWWPFVFAAGYLSVGSLILAGWVITPLVTIAIFFLLSAFHFGGEGPFPMAVVEGGMVIWVPFLARPVEAVRLLSWVTPGRQTESIQSFVVEVRPFLWVLALILAGRVIWVASVGLCDSRPRIVLEAVRLAVFAGLFATAPVLLSFIAFFCGWHSTREIAQLAARANPSRPFRGLAWVIRESAPLTVVVVIATAVAAWWQLAGGQSAELVVVQAVFLGLSAVAVPHILLHAIAQRLHVDPFPAGFNS